MKKASYREPDYAFGKLMLTLRMSIGLTQAGLAEFLGVSRHAVGGWEVGQSYPKAEHLKAFIALALQQHVWAAGREAVEIRVFWRAAHQKVLLDELWLQEVLSQQAHPRVDVAGEQTRGDDRVSMPQASGEPRVDWGEALDVPTFYGREEELALLSRWVVEERCRVVSVLGMGGIGKSALAVTLMHQVAAHFEVVLWRSLRDVPACEALLDACLQGIAPQALRGLPDSLEERLHLLMEQMRDRRVLLVLDNLEMLLEEGTGTGRMRADSQGYARLLRRIGETAHQSCLLLTSREKPAELVPLEGSRSPVRALRLAGLDGRAGAQLLAEKDVVGPPHDRVRLVEVYRGNPLALKIVAQTIVELFGGEIVPFLEQGEVVFGGVCLQVLQDPEAANTMFQCVAWSPDGRLLACGSYRRGVQVWEMTTRTRRWVGQTQQPIGIRRVAWSPDGTRLVGGGEDGCVYVWDATDGTRLLRLAGHHGAVRSVAWSPDGMQLASAGGGREGVELFVWEAYSGERVRALAEHPGVAFAVAWSPSGERLISGGSDSMLRWWEVDSGQCVRVRKAHQGTVQAFKVSPDGSMLASCGNDGAIVLWDLHNGEPLRTLRRDRPYERLNITGIQGLSEAQKASLRALGAIEDSPS